MNTGLVMGTCTEDHTYKVFFPRRGDACRCSYGRHIGVRKSMPSVVGLGYS